MPRNHEEILAWCLQKDKANGGNNTQPDKAFVNKERGCGRCPTQVTLRNARGGGSLAFILLHYAPCLTVLINNN